MEPATRLMFSTVRGLSGEAVWDGVPERLGTVEPG